MKNKILSLFPIVGGIIGAVATIGSASLLISIIPTISIILGLGLAYFIGKSISLYFKNRVKVILVAEDNNTNFYLIKEYLQHFNIKIVRAHTGEEAIMMCHQYNTKLVIMDIALEGPMTGLEASKIITDSRPHQNIIANTAYQFSREEAKDSGCVDLMRKPVVQDDFLKMVKKYIKL